MTVLQTPAPRQTAARHIAPQRTLLGTALDLPEVRWAGLALVLFALGGIVQVVGAPAPLWWALYLACYVAGGWEPALSGLRALRDKTLDVDVLMIVAAIAAAMIGQVLDGALLIVIFSTSGALEAFVTRRTADSVGALLKLAPDRVTRIYPAEERDVRGQSEDQVDVADLQIGDLILVRPGERIGADGVVRDGSSDVDQATITGEPMPVAKAPGAEVYAGTVNGTGSLVVRVTAPAHESVVARIVALVEEASQTKAKTHLFIEKVEQRYSLVVVAATLLIVTIPLLGGAAFQPSLLRAMTFMIVASPCAVVLATMPPLLAAIANAGRHGVLVKSAVAQENLRQVDTIAFDKTGTLTHGAPQVAELATLADLDADQVLAAAAGAEQHSEHPIARAVTSAARARGLTLPDTTEFHALPGRGVIATIAGRTIRVGSPAQLDDLPAIDTSAAQVRALEESGHTVIVVVIDERPVGAIALIDQIRGTARPTIERLAAMGAHPVLLTGDHTLAAHQVADQVGITEAHGGLLPDQKADVVTAMQEAGRRVMLVGDGINDAPAMATADVGTAMGRGGSDLAVETADVILVHDDITAVPSTISLARRAHRVVKANIVFAACVIAALVTWDFIGHLPLPLGVAGHEGSTVVVGLNGLRLLRKRVWETATKRA